MKALGSGADDAPGSLYGELECRGRSCTPRPRSCVTVGRIGERRAGGRDGAGTAFGEDRRTSSDRRSGAERRGCWRPTQAVVMSNGAVARSRWRGAERSTPGNADQRTTMEVRPGSSGSDVNVRVRRARGTRSFA